MAHKDTPEIRHFDRDLDLSNAGRGVWLVRENFYKIPLHKFITKFFWIKVKVPKYIHTRFEKISENQEAAKLRISKQQGQKAQVTLSLSDAILNLDTTEEIPREHKLDVSVVTRQTLGVFSHVIRKLNPFKRKLTSLIRLTSKQRSEITRLCQKARKSTWKDELFKSWRQDL